jgi:site-specific recombinase XerD
VSTVETTDLTRNAFVEMLAELGGPDALRYQFMASGEYRAHPIGQLAGRYLDALTFEEYSQSTITNRTQTLSWLTFDHPTLEPADITYELLVEFLMTHWKDAAPNTKAQHVSSLKNFFEWAYEHDHIPSNPAKKLKPPRKPETERRSHSHDIIKRLVLAQPQRRDRVAILTMYWCALRRNELRQVQFRHIDLGRRVLTVFGKGGRVNEQNIPEPLALELERLILDRQADPDEFLLYPQKVGRRGGWPTYAQDIIWENRFAPLTQPGIDKWWQRCRARAGLGEGDSKVLMHELRHTAGTHAQEAGHDLLATQELLRHRSAATTERTYIHIDRRQAVARVQRQMTDPMADTENE